MGSGRLASYLSSHSRSEHMIFLLIFVAQLFMFVVVALQLTCYGIAYAYCQDEVIHEAWFVQLAQ
jgi:hypothetical protein